MRWREGRSEWRRGVHGHTIAVHHILVKLKFKVTEYLFEPKTPQATRQQLGALVSPSCHFAFITIQTFHSSPFWLMGPHSLYQASVLISLTPQVSASHTSFFFRKIWDSSSGVLRLPHSLFTAFQIHQSITATATWPRSTHSSRKNPEITCINQQSWLHCECTP